MNGIQEVRGSIPLISTREQTTVFVKKIVVCFYYKVNGAVFNPEIQHRFIIQLSSFCNQRLYASGYIEVNPALFQAFYEVLP